jgi:hypothetical protein
VEESTGKVSICEPEISIVFKLSPIRKLDHFNCWRAFALAFPEKSCFRWRPIDIPRPSGPLDSYLFHLNSPTAQWLTCLSISTERVTKYELIRLPTMLENLVSLEIIPPPVEEEIVNDRLVRAWVDLINDTGGRNVFGRLRVLAVRNPHGITSRSVDLLNNFPKLTVFIAQLKNRNIAEFETVASKRGWLVKTPKELQYTKIADDGQWERFSHVYGMMLLQTRVFRNQERDMEVAEMLNPPCVDFSFGRPWVNRGASDPTFSIMPDHPYPTPHNRKLKTVCFVQANRGHERTTIPQETHIKRPPQSFQQPPYLLQKRMKTIGRGRDLESMLSSFSSQPVRPSARRTQNRS